MSRINKEGVLDTQRIEFVMGKTKWVLDVECFGDMTITNMGPYHKVSLEMKCKEIVPQPGDSDFMEDVRALAKQYGLKIDNIEVSNNN